MLNEILKNTRALLSSPPKKEIYFYFKTLLIHLKENYPDAEVPSIEIVYSLNKLCETFRYGQNIYIIYDQSLGQSFNKFNRLIYHEDAQDVRAYLCKLIGVEYYLINDIENCITFMISHTVNSKATFFDLPKDFILKKNELIVVQESFVLFHELAHNLVESNGELLLKGQRFLETNEYAKIIMTIFNEPQENKNKINFPHFYEELTCDMIAMELTYSYFRKKEKFNANSIIEGISLAFLYLRTLIDIKLKASGKYETSGNKYQLFTKLRYNLLRYYYTDSHLFDIDKGNPPQLIELYENWEEKIDMEIVLFLDEDYRIKLTNIMKQKNVKMKKEVAKEMLGI